MATSLESSLDFDNVDSQGVRVDCRASVSKHAGYSVVTDATLAYLDALVFHGQAPPWT